MLRLVRSRKRHLAYSIHEGVDMANFWESIAVQAETVVESESDSSFWSILANPTKPKVKTPVLDKAKVQKSKAVIKSAEVYETIGGLVTPSTECTHYWVIGTATPQDIGVCKLCHGEKMFTNSFLMAFNDTPIADLHGSLGSTEGGA